MFGFVSRRKYDDLNLRLKELQIRENYNADISGVKRDNFLLNQQLDHAARSKKESIDAQVNAARGEMEVEYYHALHSALEEKFEKYEASLENTMKLVMTLATKVTDKFELPKPSEVKILPAIGQNNTVVQPK